MEQFECRHEISYDGRVGMVSHEKYPFSNGFSLGVYFMILFALYLQISVFWVSSILG